MKLQSIAIKAQQKTTVADNRTKLQGIKTIGYICLLGRKLGAKTEGKRKPLVKVFKTKAGVKVAYAKHNLIASAKKAQNYTNAFKASIVLAGKELLIRSKKALLKYGYSFAKTVEVAKAYLSLRNFVQSLPYGVKVLLSNKF